MKKYIFIIFFIFSITGITGFFFFKKGVEPEDKPLRFVMPTYVPKNHIKGTEFLTKQEVSEAKGQARLKMMKEKGGKYGFDISEVTYNDRFAARFDLPKRHQAVLEKGLEAFQMEMRTVGKVTYCTYTLYVDSTLDLDLPTEGITRVTSIPLAYYGGSAIQEGDRQAEGGYNYSAYREHFFIMTGKDARVPWQIDTYQRDGFPGLSLLVHKERCRESGKLFQGREIKIGLKQKGNKEIILTLPEVFIQRVTPLLAMVTDMTQWEEGIKKDKDKVKVTLITDKLGLMGGTVIFFPTDKLMKYEGYTLFDIRKAVYSKDFAQRFNLDTDYQEDLENGLKAFEVTVQTIGHVTHCTYVAYVDSTMDIDFPEGKLSHYYKGIKVYNYGGEIKQNKDFEPIEIGRKKDYYGRNSFFADTDYEWEKKGASNSWRIYEYQKDCYPHLTLLAYDNLCPLDKYVFKKGKASLWLKKKNTADYTRIQSPKKEHFNILALPDVFAQDVYAAIIETEISPSLLVPWYKKPGGYFDLSVLKKE